MGFALGQRFVGVVREKNVHSLYTHFTKLFVVCERETSCKLSIIQMLSYVCVLLCVWVKF